MRARVLVATFLAPTLLWIASALSPASAFAQGIVNVEVRTAEGDTGDAYVTLTPEGEGDPRSCATQNGRCSLAGVPAGMYVVTARPSTEGRRPLPRSVLVGAGVATVRVRLR